MVFVDSVKVRCPECGHEWYTFGDLKVACPNCKHVIENISAYVIGKGTAEDATASGLRRVYNEGYRRVCLGCNTVFKPDKVRKETVHDGGPRKIEMCRCGCDLIGYIVEGEDGLLYICRTPRIDKYSIHCDNTQKPA